MPTMYPTVAVVLWVVLAILCLLLLLAHLLTSGPGHGLDPSRPAPLTHFRRPAPKCTRKEPDPMTKNTHKQSDLHDLHDDDHTRCHHCEEQGACGNHIDSASFKPANPVKPKESQPFAFCGANPTNPWNNIWAYGSSSTANFATRTYYRYSLVSGKVLARTEYPVGGTGVGFDVYQYSLVRFTTEEQAHRAALRYCEEQSKKLSEEWRKHRDWLKAHENRPPKFALDDEVRYIGAQQGMKDKTGKVIAVQKQGPAKYAYLVDWPSYTYYNRRDWVIEASLERVTTPGAKPASVPPKGFLLDEQ